MRSIQELPYARRGYESLESPGVDIPARVLVTQFAKSIEEVYEDAARHIIPVPEFERVYDQMGGEFYTGFDALVRLQQEAGQGNAAETARSEAATVAHEVALALRRGSIALDTSYKDGAIYVGQGLTQLASTALWYGVVETHKETGRMILPGSIDIIMNLVRGNGAISQLNSHLSRYRLNPHLMRLSTPNTRLAHMRPQGR